MLVGFIGAPQVPNDHSPLPTGHTQRLGLTYVFLRAMALGRTNNRGGADQCFFPLPHVWNSSILLGGWEVAVQGWKRRGRRGEDGDTDSQEDRESTELGNSWAPQNCGGKKKKKSCSVLARQPAASLPWIVTSSDLRCQQISSSEPRQDSTATPAVLTGSDVHGSVEATLVSYLFEAF